MRKSPVEMGKYYRNTSGLVKTVCKAKNYKSFETMVAYVNVSNGGYASDILLMPENEFIKNFLLT